MATPMLGGSGCRAVAGRRDGSAFLAAVALGRGPESSGQGQSGTHATAILVRTQYLPLPAETVRELGIPGFAGCCFQG
jgi:hypothetical protein